MANQWDITSTDILKSGTNASITACKCYDGGNSLAGSVYPIIGVAARAVLCTRLQITPTTRVRSVTISCTHQNKAHGYDTYNTYYAKVSTSASAWPAFQATSSTVIGSLPSSGTFSFTISFTATDQPFYVYIWGYLNSESIGEHDQIIKKVNSITCQKGGAAVYVKTNATTWKKATAVYVKTNSTTWKEVQRLLAKTNSTTWKEAT